MKILLKLIFTFLLLFLATNINAANNNDEKLSIYNWGDYLPESVLDDFTKETGIEVEYSTYSSNEMMFTKLQILRGRGYDILVPSTNFVEKMSKSGLLQPIDKTRIDNFKNLDPSFLNRSYDLNNKYSIPYLWGSTGIAVNSKDIDVKKIRRWKDLWDKEWRDKILLIDEMRGVFHMALKVNGYSSNSTNPEEIKKAYEDLKELMPNVKMFNADLPGEEFINGNISLGSLWNGDASRAKSENSAIEYIYPREGAFFWIDSFVIPAQAENVSNAHTFINFMLRPDIAVRCVNELRYATPNRTAKALLSAEITNDPIIFPPDKVLKNAEFHRDLGKHFNTYKLYWNKLKTDR